ncbi:Uncharacterised protein [Escherichia coli]|nr:Uncharacterised protein [Escherichia coli]
MYKKGFFPYIPSPKCSYECFALFTGCASRYAPARSIAFGSFPVFARCDARPLYATVLAVAGNAAGMCSGTVLCIGMITVFNHIMVSVGILQNIFIHFCIVQSSFLFVSFQVLAVGHWSYCLLCYCQLWHAVTVSLSTCPTAFTVCRLSSCRIPSVDVPRSLVSAAPRSLCVSSDTISL